MAHPVRTVLFVAVTAALWAAWGPAPSGAQMMEEEPPTRSPDTVANLFETLDPGQPIDGLRVRLPEGWDVTSVRLLRYGTKTVPVSVRRTGEPGTHRVEVERPLTEPHDLILRVRVPDTPGAFEWDVHSLVREAVEEDTVTGPRFRTVERRTRRVTVEAPSEPDRTNQVLSLEDASEPLVLRGEALPPLGRDASFTLEFWLRTGGLDEVVLSTWNGQESVAYPAELVVDDGGRLRFYTGRPGEHRALRTDRPVADGRWHHVAAVYDAPRSRLRLLMDGQPADSLRGTPLATQPGPRPLAVGGRLEQNRSPDAPPARLFSGQLDELRVWGEARSSSTVRRMMNQPLPEAAGDEETPRLLRLGFDEEVPEAVKSGGDGVRRVPATLSFRSGLRNLRAESDDRTVTLRWTAEAADLDGFVVERSSDGEAFQSVAELDPAEAKRATGADVPAFSYTEAEVPGQVVFYRIRLQGADGSARTSGTIKIGLGTDEKQAPVRLLGNFPNPFSEATTVAYEVNEQTPVTITVFNVQGHQIVELADGVKPPGYHEAPFEATDLPSGTYFVRLKTPTDKQSDRMVLLK